MFLSDLTLLPQVKHSSIGTITWSDHAPVVLTVQLSRSIPAPFSWKNNTCILSNPTHQSFITKRLEEFFLTNNSPDIEASTLWNAHKAYMRGVLIQLSSRVKRGKSQKVDTLLQRIKSLEVQQQSSPNSSTHRDLFKARAELRTQLMDEYEYQVKKTKLTYYHAMNKPSRLMARRVAAARTKTRIPFLISQSHNGKIIDPQKIVNAFSEFYSKLYNLKDDPEVTTPSPQTITDFLAAVHLPSLDEEQLNGLNTPFTELEIENTIKSLPLGKSPGPDGFSNEYYRAFAPLLSPHLCTTFRQAMEKGVMPKEMLQATVVTLPKPGKTPDQPANFRPISLLNSDTKLYAKLLANRILKVLPSLIHPDQVGFVRGRQAPDGTRRVLNIISGLEHAKTPAILLSLDAEKAFDRIHWGFAFQTLTKLGFRGSIVSAIQALYSNPSARVLTNGVLSEPFNITNGTRQGCPLSPLIFAMIMEPLAEAIRHDLGQKISCLAKTLTFNKA